MLSGLAGLLALSISGCATFDTYTADNFHARAELHETVAILPFDVTIVTQEWREAVTEADIQTQHHDEAYVFQRQLYTELLERSDSAGYTAQIRDIDATNVLLGRGDVGYRDINSHTKNELAGLMGVDTVISGGFSRTQPIVTGGATAAAVVSGNLGAAMAGSGASVDLRGVTNAVNPTLSVHDGEDRTLLWSFDDEGSGGLGNSPESLSEGFKEGFATTFPCVQDDQAAELGIGLISLIVGEHRPNVDRP